MDNRGSVLHGRGWTVVLGLVAVVAALATSLVFWPGYMSKDTIFQLDQAMGAEPLNDWHPPVMSLLWELLIAVTGTPATMALLQTAVLWASLLAIAWVVWGLTGSRGGSLAVLGLGLTPHVLTFVGVVWKDVHMAFALLATAAVALLGLRLRPQRPAARWGLFVVALLFLVYAVLVRKNAVFAAPPMFAMVVLALWPRPAKRVWAVTAAAVVAALALTTVAISASARPEPTHQLSQVMLDDLLHVLTIDELRAADVPADLRDHLVTAAQECRRKNSLSNAYWTCYGRGENGDFTAVAHPDEISSLWFSEMPSHIPGYLQYRVQVFATQLFESRYEFQRGVVRNDHGLEVANPRLQDTLETYVDGTAVDLPILFAGWFWLVVGLVMTFRPGRGGGFSMPVRAMGLSSVLYIVGYLPILPVSNYRYVYWPAIAGSLGLLLMWLQRRQSMPGPAEGAVR